MIETLKEILLDNQQIGDDDGVPRQLEMEPVEGKASICIGVRRCGKSTLMRQTMKKLIDQGVSPENILHLNFFDDRLRFLHESGLAAVTEAFFQLYPEKKKRERIYCFFDEIQALPEWEHFVERLMRTELCEVYITGSSAQMLSREIATQMRGRALSWEMFPFSFREFLTAKGVSFRERLTSKMRLHIQSTFREYWGKGGFPEVYDLNDSLRVKIHQDYFQSILYRDLIERYDIPHPKALRDLALQLIDNAGSFYTINSLYGFLKAQNHKLQKSHIGQYIEWLEESYFLFSVRLYDPSFSRSHANPKKIYCIDHSMVRSVSTGILVNSGHLLENLVFSALRRKNSEIFYYRTKTGKEVDFIVRKNRSERELIQVCETLREEKTRAREIAALREAMSEQKLATGLIVTKEEEDEIETPGGTIRVIPAWRFLFEF